MTDHDLIESFPRIPWRKPVPIRSSDQLEDQRFGCRLCIAHKGLLGEQVSGLWRTEEEVEQHIREAHA